LPEYSEKCFGVPRLFYPSAPLRKGDGAPGIFTPYDQEKSRLAVEKVLSALQGVLRAIA
jgi:hypothetical protein